MATELYVKLSRVSKPKCIDKPILNPHQVPLGIFAEQTRFYARKSSESPSTGWAD